MTRLEARRRAARIPGTYALGAVDDVELTRAVAAAIGARSRARRAQPRPRSGRRRQHEPAEPGHRRPLVRRRPRRSSRVTSPRSSTGCRRSGSPPARSTSPGTATRGGLAPRAADRASGSRDAARRGARAVPGGDRRGRALDHDRPHRGAVDRRRAGHAQPRALTGLLRDELGFDGHGDHRRARDARGQRDTVGMEEGAVLALAAGADALCLGHDLGATTWRPCARDRRRRARRSAARRSGWPRPRSASRGSPLDAGRARRDGAPREVGPEAARRALRVEGRRRARRGPRSCRALARSRRSLPARTPRPRRARPGAPAGDQGGRPARAAHGRRRRERPAAARRRPPRRPPPRVAAGGCGGAAGLGAGRVVVDAGVPVWRPRGAEGYVVTYGAGRANLAAAAERLCPPEA